MSTKPGTRARRRLAVRMKHGTSIGWTHWPGFKGETWTVVRGCKPARYVDEDGRSRAFKTCVRCYAMCQAHSLVQRFDMPQYRGLTRATSAGAVWTGDIYFDEEQLTWPLHCKKPRCFFLTSMGDVWYSEVTPRQRARIIAIMVMTPQHRYLPLTKRPDELAKDLNCPDFKIMVREEIEAIEQRPCLHDPIPSIAPNVYWGTSIEDNASAEWALGHLEKINGNRWVSFEPAMEYVNFRRWPWLKWVVIGGGSRQNGDAFSYDVDMAQSVIETCASLTIPLYHKQLGTIPRVGDEPLRLADMTLHNDDMTLWPKGLRVREFPKGGSMISAQRERAHSDEDEDDDHPF